MKKKGKYRHRYLADLMTAIVGDYKHLATDPRGFEDVHFDVEDCGGWWIDFYCIKKCYPLVTELRRRLIDYDVEVKSCGLKKRDVIIDGTWEYVDVG